MHNDTHINASNVLCFNRVPTTTLHPIMFESQGAHVVVFAKLTLQLVPSQSCLVEIVGVIGI